ncbi:unnamed protein product [Amoebophrya sp. A25]|nr:unnamed protein product [Amoebophrya sp. A25]|eukprot:GSA25T00000864001.1
MAGRGKKVNAGQPVRRTEQAKKGSERQAPVSRGKTSTEVKERTKDIHTEKKTTAATKTKVAEKTSSTAVKRKKQSAPLANNPFAALMGLAGTASDSDLEEASADVEERDNYDDDETSHHDEDRTDEKSTAETEQDDNADKESVDNCDEDDESKQGDDNSAEAASSSKTNRSPSTTSRLLSFPGGIIGETISEGSGDKRVRVGDVVEVKYKVYLVQKLLDTADRSQQGGATSSATGGATAGVSDTNETSRTKPEAERRQAFSASNIAGSISERVFALLPGRLVPEEPQVNAAQADGTPKTESSCASSASTFAPRTSSENVDESQHKVKTIVLEDTSFSAQMRKNDELRLAASTAPSLDDFLKLVQTHGLKGSSILEKVKPADKGEVDWVCGTHGMIQGFDQGVRGMRKSEIRKFFVPSKQAYGKKGAAGKIPKNADLVFLVRVEKIGIDWDGENNVLSSTVSGRKRKYTAKERDIRNRRAKKAKKS